MIHIYLFFKLKNKLLVELAASVNVKQQQYLEGSIYFYFIFQLAQLHFKKLSIGVCRNKYIFWAP